MEQNLARNSRNGCNQKLFAKGKLFMKNRSRIALFVSIALVAAVAVGAFVGCGGDGGSNIFLTLSERGAWGPNGEFAVSAWGANQIRYIYAVGEGGNHVELLTESDDDDDDDFSDEGGWHPVYSNDGETIYMAARRNGRDGIYAMDAEEGDFDNEATQITVPAGDGGDGMPSVSPAGDTIVFTTTEGTGYRRLATVNTDGSNRQIIVDEAGVNLRWPVYTPDATQIIYERRVVGTEQSDIYVYDMATGTSSPLIASNFDEGAPAISPDGTTILFQSDRNGPNHDIWVADSDGSNVRAFTSSAHTDGFPIFSPDGQDIAFLRDRELWRVNFVANEDDRDYEQITERYD